MASGANSRCAKRLSLQTVLATVIDSNDEDSDNDSDESYDDEVRDPDYVADAAEDPDIIAEVDENEIPNNTEVRLARKRKAEPSSWQRNIKSKTYNTGQRKSYNGHTTPRKVGETCAESCKLSCSSKFNADDRQIIFDAYWKTNSHERRRDFIVNHARKFAKRRSLTNGAPSRRANTVYYFLPCKSENVRVCKIFFLKTLDISDSTIRHNLEYFSAGFAVVAKPRKPVNKLPDADKQTVINHINSFPKIDSHYCRATTKRQYLDPTLSVNALYKLYITKCLEEKWNPVKESMYRYIFNTEFNLGFHNPSKDVCDTCSKYQLKKEGNVLSESDELQQIQHLKRKQQARTTKETDKMVIDGSHITAVFDLQQVLTAPKLNVGSAYYLRKLNVYNFTILELQTHQGFCYTWNESEGKRGTNEIASALTCWLLEKDREGYTRVILYSDSCGGQNRNRLMCTALIHFLCNAKNIKIIEQKFFETGHSQNECDSMHSCIERQFSKSNVFLPSGFQQHMKNANKRKPYNISELGFDSFYDFDELNSRVFKQNAFAGIISTHHIIYSIDHKDVKVTFADEIGGMHCEKAYRKRGQPVNLKSYVLSQAYNSQLNIDVQKRDDLLKLSEYLPKDCQNFYRQLPVDD
ncbi:hypothetical protein SNE40_010374 [Patella caerulea]